MDGELQRICQKAMEQKPSRRFKSALELAQWLERWRDDLIDPEFERRWRQYLFFWQHHPRLTLLVAYVVLVILGVVGVRALENFFGVDVTIWLRKLLYILDPRYWS